MREKAIWFEIKYKNNSHTVTEVMVINPFKLKGSLRKNTGLICPK